MKKDNVLVFPVGHSGLAESERPGLEELLVMDHVETHDVVRVAVGYALTNRSYGNG